MHSRQVCSLFIITLLLNRFNIAKGLLCYRCDSKIDQDCPFYPSPMSTYENCIERPHTLRRAYQANVERHDSASELPSDSADTQTLFVRYRYKLCPVMERTVQQVVPFTPSPMENVNYICGKAVTHDKDGIRVRRGCTPDLFLNGADACVSVSPWGKTDVACFCTTDFCNQGSYHSTKTSSVLALLCLPFCLANVCL